MKCRSQSDTRSLDEKERDVEYQRKRVRLFRQLIAHYPETRSQILLVLFSFVVWPCSYMKELDEFLLSIFFSF